MKFYGIYDNNCWDFQHLVSFLNKASSEFCSPCGPCEMFIYMDFIFPVRSDWSDFDSSKPEAMQGLLGAEFKFTGHDGKLSLSFPAPTP